MAKYDAVDRLMKMATEKPAKASAAQSRGERDAEAVLEAQVAGAEPLPQAGTVPTPGSPALAVPEMSPSERGRQILGALRPFLPAVGGALRLVDHGAVQAVARLLPMLGNLGSSQSASPAAPPEVIRHSEKQQSAFQEQLAGYRARLENAEEQMRRMRETLERTVAEQGSLTHKGSQLADRTRLLTAAVVIFGLIAVASLVLAGVALHR